jgi:hypothetical protein
MLFFAPFAAFYCVYEMIQRRLVGQWKVWLQLSLAAILVAAITWPFASAYFELREVAGLGVRSVDDLVQFSADTHAFATPPRRARLLAAWLDGYSKPEGAGFPGVTILGLATIGLIWGARRAVADLGWSTLGDWHAVAVVLVGAVFGGSTALLAWFFVQGRVNVTLGARHMSYSDASTILVVCLASLGLIFILTSVVRGRNTVPSTTAFGFFAIATIMAAFLAMGPEIQVLGRRVSDGPYRLLFEYVPGFDGLRVPARYLMLVALFLSVLAGLGAAAMATIRRPIGPVLMIVAAAAVVSEAWAVPMPMNGGGRPRPGLLAPQPPATGRATPAIYQFIRDHSAPMALLELPFGDPAYELMAVFYAGHHRKPIVNGYSGWFPAGYRRNVGPLRDVLEDPDRALRALGRSQATHVLVHEAAWPADEGRQVSTWLTGLGARLVTSSGSDRLFELPKIAASPE